MTTPRTPRAAAVVLAGGSGRRLGAEVNKVLLPVRGAAVLAHAVATVLEVEAIQRVLVVVRPEDREEVSAALAPILGGHDLWLVDGGAERHDSEWAAVAVLAEEIENGELEVVAIHDGARPLASAGLWREVIGAAAEAGGAIPVLAAPPLSYRDGRRAPADLAVVQTPQAFAAPALLNAYRQAAAEGFRGTDTAACLERYAAVRIVAVPGTTENLKVTFPADLELATQLLG